MRRCDSDEVVEYEVDRAEWSIRVGKKSRVVGCEAGFRVNCAIERQGAVAPVKVCDGSTCWVGGKFFLEGGLGRK